MTTNGETPEQERERLLEEKRQKVERDRSLYRDRLISEATEGDPGEMAEGIVIRETGPVEPEGAVPATEDWYFALPTTEPPPLSLVLPSMKRQHADLAVSVQDDSASSLNVVAAGMFSRGVHYGGAVRPVYEVWPVEDGLVANVSTSIGEFMQVGTRLLPVPDDATEPDEPLRDPHDTVPDPDYF